MRILYSFDNERLSIELPLVDDVAEMISCVCGELRKRHSLRSTLVGIEATIADAMLNALASAEKEAQIGDLGSDG